MNVHETPETAVAPTRGRYKLLAFLGGMTFILYLDRVCMGQAGPTIQEELNMSNTQMGYVLAAFTIAYGLFEIPIGHLGDRWGSRGVLTRIVIWWSVFTCLTGAVNGFLTLIVVRFLFGGGEAGALPNAARVLSRWFSESTRGTAQGIVTTCMMVGGAVSPPVAAKLIALVGWRYTFVIFGGLGVIWASAFYWWFRDNPGEHPAVNDAELELIRQGKSDAASIEPPPINWEKVLGIPTVWLMGILMTCNSSVYYMLISWYTQYLQKAREISPEQSGNLAGLVLAGGAIGCISGGRIMDWLIRKTNDRRFSRAILGGGALSFGALNMWFGVYTDHPIVSACCISIACFCVQLQIPAWWSTVTQISGRYLGAMFGLMNSMGIPGAAASQIMLGHSTDWLKRLGFEGRATWDPGMYVYGGVMLFAASLWLFINPNQSVDEE